MVCVWMTSVPGAPDLVQTSEGCMAGLVYEFETSVQDMASSCACLVKSGECGTPHNPILSVIKVLLYLTFSAAGTRSWYLVSFLSAVASNDISKLTVTYVIHSCFWPSSHQTMSGCKVVGVMWRGN